MNKYLVIALVLILILAIGCTQLVELAGAGTQKRYGGDPSHATSEPVFLTATAGASPTQHFLYVTLPPVIHIPPPGTPIPIEPQSQDEFFVATVERP